jgi:glycogen debranching enzyme
MGTDFPLLKTEQRRYDYAWRVAMGDIYGNILPWQDGLLREPERCIMAGLFYPSPWTRDASINTSNGAGLLYPTEARNTLLSCVTSDADGSRRVGGQYWDAIVWATGAWDYYLYTGDRGFLELAADVVRNSLRYFERTEFDAGRGLFRGGGCFLDGVAGYPDRYTNPDWHSGIDDWPAKHPNERHPVGEGFPAHTLSTNCLYYRAYVLIDDMAKELGQPVDGADSRKADALRNAINRHFWSPGRGTYGFLVDDAGRDERQEGLGIAFAILFGVADAEQARQVLGHFHTTPHGITCLWPQYERYQTGPGAFSRHAGTIWPQVNAYWCEALARSGRHAEAWREMRVLSERVWRDSHFAEIYHPETGEIYGGLQEDTKAKGIRLWRSLPRQTWCATGYVRMWLRVVFGMDFRKDGIAFRPWLPEELTHGELTGLHYRRARLSLRVEGHGALKRFCLDGRDLPEPVLPDTLEGDHSVTVALG